MSIVSVSYGSLRAASGSAEQVSRRLDTYADSMERTVYQRLNQYSGDWTHGLSVAMDCTGTKIHQARDLSRQYQDYARKLDNVRIECIDTDRAVRSQISALTASFKAAHGISNSAVKNGLGFLLTKMQNGTALGRLRGDQFDAKTAADRYFKDTLKAWYDFGGGKEFLKGFLVSMLEIAIGVAAICAAFASGGIVLIVAGVIGGVISVINGFTDYYYEISAYAWNTAGDASDPAMARRLRRIDTLPDALRKSDSKGAHRFASAIEVVDLICTAISLGGGLKKLADRGLQWSGKMDKLKFRDYFKAGTWKEFGAKARKTLRSGWNGVKEWTKSGMKSLGAKDWDFFKASYHKFQVDFLDEFKSTFQSIYLKDIRTFQELSESAGNMKTLLEGTKVIVEGGFKPLSLLSGGSYGLVLPCINVFRIADKADDRYSTGDIADIINDGSGAGSGVWNGFSTKHVISDEIRKKLSESSKVSVNIPTIALPDIQVISGRVLPPIRLEPVPIHPPRISLRTVHSPDLMRSFISPAQRARTFADGVYTPASPAQTGGKP